MGERSGVRESRPSEMYERNGWGGELERGIGKL